MAYRCVVLGLGFGFKAYRVNYRTPKPLWVIFVVQLVGFEGDLSMKGPEAFRARGWGSPCRPQLYE